MRKKRDEMGRNFIFKFRINPASIKLDLKIFNYWLLLRLVRHPDTITNGITNRCQDMLHYVFFADFDNIYYETMRAQLLALQKQERMSDIIIMKTSEETDGYGNVIGSYHAYELTKRKLWEIPQLLMRVCVDPNSIRVPRLFSGKAWVLRTEPKVKMSNGEIIKGKPEPKEILPSTYTKGEQSFAHYFYLRNQFDIPYLIENWDNSTKIQKIQYTTTSKRWHTHWIRIVL